MDPFEYKLSLKQKYEAGASFLQEQPFWIVWIRDIFWSFSSNPSVYDYAARVVLAKRKMESLSDRYRSSNRLILEQVLVNLTPNPLAFLRLINPDASYARNSTQPFPALHDSTAKEAPDLIKLRAELLAKAFSKYMSTALALIEEEIKDMVISDFQNRWLKMEQQVNETLQQLVTCRLALYKNFPKEELGSVRPDMEKFQRSLDLRDGLENVAEIKRQIAGFERILILLLEKVIKDIKLEIEAIGNRKLDVLSRVDEAKEIYRTVGGFFEKEVQKEVEEDFNHYRQEIEDRFAPAQFFPPAPFQDVAEGRSQYCGGNVPVPESMLKTAKANRSAISGSGVS